jgi:hypothetical protein
LRIVVVGGRLRGHDVFFERSPASFHQWFEQKKARR